MRMITRTNLNNNLSIEGSSVPSVTAEDMSTISTSSSESINRTSRQKRLRKNSKYQRSSQIIILQVLFLCIFLGGWEVGADQGVINKFLFSSPSDVISVLVSQFRRGDLMLNVQVTTYETIMGYLIGAVGGSILGLLLWLSKFVADFSQPFIAALGSIPVLAVAPMLIIWFGTGFKSKVVVAAFSCVVVALINAYQGTQKVDKDQLELFHSFDASKIQIFWKLIVPESVPWLMVSLKLNVGFALIGAIVGEFISANAGVGHMIVVAGASFEIGEVLAGVVLVMIMVLVFNLFITALEQILRRRHFM